jgi:prepilin-type N-terminal cleavage/methylation domain-containing protein
MMSRPCPPRHTSLGFSLIELMIVVCIIGLLASVAIPAFVRYLKYSKTSEVHLNLKSLGDGAVSYHQADHYDLAGRPLSDQQYPGADAQTYSNPAAVPKGTKTTTTGDSWRVTPWKELKFSMIRPQYYQYKFVQHNAVGGSEDVFTASAFGDLDADDVQSHFIVTGIATQNGEIRLSPVYAGDDIDALE